MKELWKTGVCLRVHVYVVKVHVCTYLHTCVLVSFYIKLLMNSNKNDHEIFITNIKNCMHSYFS